MSSQPDHRPTRRPPLADATWRVNNTLYEATIPSKAASIPRHEGLRPELLPPARKESAASSLSQADNYPLRDLQRADSPTSNAANPRLSAISKNNATDSKRNSQISTVSTNASDGKKIKAYIGPWKLGKTLGKGATARVRLARHAFTGQEAAIKIVQKKSAQISQASSLAALDKIDSATPDAKDGTRRMPIGVEREVAIMKLVQHPNIMKLHDIWESRTEIYLVLEYVDGGELFGVITARGRLDEEDAMVYFRQILAAVGYCHSLNICHRDLKPENVLVTKDGTIKIADFGMAALHQSPGHKLDTSCGSPHYAAPEVVKGGSYRGDKTDIWSLGVILYATLAGRLPFDTKGNEKDWIPGLLAKIKRGVYEMPTEFSSGAADLIWRILQVNPKNRIEMSQIWEHSLIRKYDYLDNYGAGYMPVSPSAKDFGRPVRHKSDISKEILRHLRSLWHRLSEQQLIDALLSAEPNEQKLFYSLLAKYRDAQLENYVPDLSFSTSDYHYVKEKPLTKTYSTMHFPQPKSKSNIHGRQASRFTVISNAADTEHSYDPFKASRPQHLDSMRTADYAKITIHQNRCNPQERKDASTDKTKQPEASRASLSVGSGRGKQNLGRPRVIASRSSLASSTRSRSSGNYVRATVRHKRSINFSHRRRRSTSSQDNKSADTKPATVERHSNHTEVTDNGGDSLQRVEQASSYIRSKKPQAAVSQSLVSATRPGRASQLWQEDVRQLSSSLAMDCDEAFNRTSIVSDANPTVNESVPSVQASRTVRKTSPPAKHQPPASQQKSRLTPYDNRPLPPPPAQSGSIRIELMKARQQAELRKASGAGGESPRYLDRLVSHIDNLMGPPPPPERRILSAPVEYKRNASSRPLPSIYEAFKEDESPHRLTDYDGYLVSQHGFKANRNASAPEPRETDKIYRNNRFGSTESGVRGTIRVVEASSPSPVKVPAPLTIRKRSSRGPSNSTDLLSPGSGRSTSEELAAGLELRQQYGNSSAHSMPTDGDCIDDTKFGIESNTGTILKKPGWFKRNSKLGEGDFRISSERNNRFLSQSSSKDANPRLGIHSAAPPQHEKKFSLGRLFKKRSSKRDMTLGADDHEDNDSLPDSVAHIQRQPYFSRISSNKDPETRQIVPQRNWLATLFKVKPVSKSVCFAVSNRRARQEIVTVLKEWKRHGIKDIQVDKKRNIVFGKVASKNFLDMKEVAFACEVMKVIEHGKKTHLSIARFTQEFGAASSFYKVVDTMETVLKCRGMLVTDERKKRMMTKTLNSARTA